MRKSEIVKRKTKETDIVCQMNLDGTGICNTNTGIGFFDHMINTLSKHSFIDIDITCKGDLNVDDHHSVEDCGIALGMAFKDALKSKDGINRYASFTMAMDDALVLCAIDLCGRNYYEANDTFNSLTLSTK